MPRILLMTVLLLSVSTAAAQDVEDFASPFFPIEPVTPAAPQIEAPQPFEWAPALQQSYRMLLVEHGFRLAFQQKTRRELGGPFIGDYLRSFKGLRGWQDGDSWLTNYVGHPMQGAVAGYLYVQNSPSARSQEFSSASPYWGSRLKAMLWSAAYSANFELGPLSEASLGNVGLNPATSGYVDHVMTPTGGFAMMLGEDAVDRFLIRRWEDRTDSDRVRRLLRMAFNPSRSMANVLRGKAPWHRDTRPLPASNQFSR